MSYRIVVDQRLMKKLLRIPPTHAKRIRDTIGDLKEDPRPHDSKKLRGKHSLYRVRIGTYRVVYEVSDSDKLVTIYDIDHRKNVYK